MWASVTVPDSAPHESGRATVNVTSTLTLRGFGAFVWNTTEARYSPGARFGSPIVSVTSSEPPAAIVPVRRGLGQPRDVGEEA